MKPTIEIGVVSRARVQCDICRKPIARGQAIEHNRAANLIAHGIGACAAISHDRAILQSARFAKTLDAMRSARLHADIAAFETWRTEFSRAT